MFRHLVFPHSAFVMQGKSVPGYWVGLLLIYTNPSSATPLGLGVGLACDRDLLAQWNEEMLVGATYWEISWDDSVDGGLLDDHSRNWRTCDRAKTSTLARMLKKDTEIAEVPINQLLIYSVMGRWGWLWHHFLLLILRHDFFSVQRPCNINKLNKIEIYMKISSANILQF